MARSRGGLSPAKPSKTAASSHTRARGEPAALFRELFFFWQEAPGIEPTHSSLRLGGEPLRPCVSRFSCISTVYCSVLSSSSSSSSYASCHPATGFKSYGIFLPLRRNLPRAGFQLFIPKQTITSLSQIFLALLFRENVMRPARVADLAFNDFSMNLCNIFNSFLIETFKWKIVWIHRCLRVVFITESLKRYFSS